MLKTIDRYNGHVIQKVCKSDGSVRRYQTVGILGDSSTVQAHASLAGARSYLGMPAASNPAINVAKAQFPQNQKGYRADSKRGK